MIHTIITVHKQPEYNGLDYSKTCSAIMSARPNVYEVKNATTLAHAEVFASGLATACEVWRGVRCLLLESPIDLLTLSGSTAHAGQDFR